MSKTMKYILICIVIAIIALAIFVGQEGIKNNKKESVETTATINENNSTVVSKPEPQKTEPTVEVKTVNSTPENIVSSTTLSKEDKAKELAKQKWGGNDGVYFSIDTINNDETYVVSVRDSATTKVLEWYTVDITTGNIKN